MIDSGRFPPNPVDMYSLCGFAVVSIFDEGQFQTLERFAKSWIYRLLAEWIADNEVSPPLETYHVWSKPLMVDHHNVFCARNRHTRPDPQVEEALINEELKRFLTSIGLQRYKIWDDGLGWLAFRFIRPGMGDGYPLSRKAWGIAKNAVSCWVPIVGFNPSETLTLVPGSHLRDYERILPTNEKFAKDEYRLAPGYRDLELYSPKLERGQAVFYHPKTLHSQDVVASSVTRLNLEFRFNPIRSQE